METTTQQIIYQVLMIAVTISVAGITAYVRKYINTKVQLEEYGLGKQKLNDLLTEAVLFAEQKGKEFAKQSATKLASDIKLDYAKQYINKIDKSVIAEYGNNINDVLSAKVAETFGTSLRG